MSEVKLLYVQLCLDKFNAFISIQNILKELVEHADLAPSTVYRPFLVSGKAQLCQILPSAIEYLPHRELIVLLPSNEIADVTYTLSYRSASGSIKRKMSDPPRESETSPNKRLCLPGRDVAETPETEIQTPAADPAPVDAVDLFLESSITSTASSDTVSKQTAILSPKTAISSPKIPKVKTFSLSTIIVAHMMNRGQIAVNKIPINARIQDVKNIILAQNPTLHTGMQRGFHIAVGGRFLRDHMPAIDLKKSLPCVLWHVTMPTKLSEGLEVIIHTPMRKIRLDNVPPTGKLFYCFDRLVDELGEDPYRDGFFYDARTGQKIDQFDLSISRLSADKHASSYSFFYLPNELYINVELAVNSPRKISGLPMTFMLRACSFVEDLKQKISARIGPIKVQDQHIFFPTNDSLETTQLYSNDHIFRYVAPKTTVYLSVN